MQTRASTANNRRKFQKSLLRARMSLCSLSICKEQAILLVQQSLSFIHADIFLSPCNKLMHSKKKNRSLPEWSTFVEGMVLEDIIYTINIWISRSIPRNKPTRSHDVWYAATPWGPSTQQSRWEPARPQKAAGRSGDGRPVCYIREARHAADYNLLPVVKGPFNAKSFIMITFH